MEVLKPLPSYQQARQLCRGCDFADVAPSGAGDSQFIIECHAPVIPIVTPLRKRRFNQREERLPDTRVIVKLRYVPERRALCTFLVPNQYSCNRASAVHRATLMPSEMEVDKGALERGEIDLSVL